MKPATPKSLGQIAYEAHFAKWANCIACWKEEDPRLHATYERIARAVEREVLRRIKLKRADIGHAVDMLLGKAPLKLRLPVKKK